MGRSTGNPAKIWSKKTKWRHPLNSYGNSVFTIWVVWQENRKVNSDSGLYLSSLLFSFKLNFNVFSKAPPSVLDDYENRCIGAFAWQRQLSLCKWQLHRKCRWHFHRRFCKKTNLQNSVFFFQFKSLLVGFVPQTKLIAYCDVILGWIKVLLVLLWFISHPILGVLRPETL